MNTRYNSIDFYTVDFTKEVNEEMERGKELNAFLLAHNFIESYLREWLFYSGDSQKQSENKFLKRMDRISFKNLILIHVVLGNITRENFLTLEKINKLRNKIAHNLFKMNYKETAFREYLHSEIEHSVDLCKMIQKYYQSALDRKAKLV